LKITDPVLIELESLIQAIYLRFQYDFRQYARSSLRRRLEQAMIRFHCASISELQHRVLFEKDFFLQIIPYLTVNTTEMFRDPSYFATLRGKVFPYLQTYPSIRIWVAGCSTGEEVLSLSILLNEMNIKRFIIYATDINPHNLEVAAKGIYDRESIQKASKNYQLCGGKGSLSDYYHSAYESVKFDSELLKNVVFSDHSLATDSVFAETHFVSCRNVLIYFDRKLQDRVLRLFNDSLIREGFLGLGNKETIQFSSIKDDFDVVDSPNRIYQKKRGGST